MTSSPAQLAEQAVSAVLADLGSGSHRGVVVDSPPGAGKSVLVVRAAADLAMAGEQVMVVAQTNEQVDDLTDRLASAQPGLPMGRLCAQDYPPPQRVTAHAQVSVASRAADLAGCGVVLGTAAKWATVTGGLGLALGDRG